MGKTILLGELLIDGTGSVPVENPAIIIHDGRIKNIFSQGSLNEIELEGINILDHSESAILPGLIDSHVHLTFKPGHDHETVRQTLKDETRQGWLPYRGLRNAQQALRGGITTLRDSGSKGLSTFALRDAVHQGLFPGPSILASGMPITRTNGHLHYCGLTADTDEEIRAAVRMLCEKGADWIKVAASGGNMTQESNSLACQYSQEQLSIIVHEANQFGKKVEAHALNIPSIENCIQAGVSHIAHCVWQNERGEIQYMEELVEKIIHRGIYVEMTVSGYLRPLLPQPDDTQLEKEKKAIELRNFWEPMRKMWQAGVKVIVHSDAGVRLTDFDTFNQGLWMMSLGLDIPPIDVIRSATQRAAEALGIGHQVGTIEVGKQADILVVARNPLEDLKRVSDVEMVMKSGKVVFASGQLIR